MKIRERLKAILADRKPLSGRSMCDAAQFNALAIEYANGMPANYDGHLDTDEPPRFIAVNPDWTREDQDYFIAREIARFHQLCRRDSHIINHPRRWNSLATAPTKTRDFIYRFDVELRAEGIMFWYATKHNYLGFPKRHPKTFLLILAADGISNFIFLKLYIRSFLHRVLSSAGLAKPKLVA
jgi:hypothetical protein